MWKARQLGDVVHDFRDECVRGDPETWRKILVNYALLLALGPAASGVCKMLTNGKGLWELKAKNDSIQPRLLFYVEGDQLIFVYCFIKKNDSMYKRAIETGLKRRKQIQQGKAVYAINTQVH